MKPQTRAVQLCILLFTILIFTKNSYADWISWNYSSNWGQVLYAQASARLDSIDTETGMVTLTKNPGNGDFVIRVHVSRIDQLVLTNDWFDGWRNIAPRQEIYDTTPIDPPYERWIVVKPWSPLDFSTLSVVSEQTGRVTVRGAIVGFSNMTFTIRFTLADGSFVIQDLRSEYIVEQTTPR